MSMYRLPKDYESIVQEVLSKPISKIVALLPNIDINELRMSIQFLTEFLKINGPSIGDNRFVIRIINQHDTPGQGYKLSVSHIIDVLADGNNVLSIDSNGCLLSQSSFIELDNASLSSFSEGKVIVLVDCGQYLEFYANGCYIKELNVFNPGSSPRQTTKLSRLAKDFPLIILDHYQKHVKYAQSTRHWHDRPHRILISSPHKTEFIFHKDLLIWFEDHKTDFIVFGEVSKLSPDRTDIELITIKGAKRYIIEVKWLGENASGTKYDEEKIRRGIKQIKEYLERDKQTLIAAVVVYNGRSEDDYRNLEQESCYYCDEWCELLRWANEEVPERGKCLVFFLDSKTASTA